MCIFDWCSKWVEWLAPTVRNGLMKFIGKVIYIVKRYLYRLIFAFLIVSIYNDLVNSFLSRCSFCSVNTWQIVQIKFKAKWLFTFFITVICSKVGKSAYCPIRARRCSNSGGYSIKLYLLQLICFCWLAPLHFLVLLCPAEKLRVEIAWANIVLALYSIFQFLLQQKVVYSSTVIMSVMLKAFFCLLNILIVINHSI